MARWQRRRLLPGLLLLLQLLAVAVAPGEAERLQVHIEVRARRACWWNPLTSSLCVNGARAQPTGVVPLTLLELGAVNVTDPLCAVGFKCPLEGGVCCADRKTCCPFGCDPEQKERVCLPNVSAPAMHTGAIPAKPLTLRAMMRRRSTTWSRKRGTRCVRALRLVVGAAPPPSQCARRRWPKWRARRPCAT